MVCKRGIIWFFYFNLKLKIELSSITNGNKIYQHGGIMQLCLRTSTFILFFLPNVFSFNAYTSLLKSFVKFNWSVLLYVVYENHTCIDPICISSCKSLYFVLDPNHTQYAETIYVLIYVSSIHDFMYPVYVSDGSLLFSYL